jgi:hypothetical protein
MIRTIPFGNIRGSSLKWVRRATRQPLPKFNADALQRIMPDNAIHCNWKNYFPFACGGEGGIFGVVRMTQH